MTFHRKFSKLKRTCFENDTRAGNTNNCELWTIKSDRLYEPHFPGIVRNERSYKLFRKSFFHLTFSFSISIGKSRARSLIWRPLKIRNYPRFENDVKDSDLSGKVDDAFLCYRNVFRIFVWVERIVVFRYWDILRLHFVFPLWWFILLSIVYHNNCIATSNRKYYSYLHIAKKTGCK